MSAEFERKTESEATYIQFLSTEDIRKINVLVNREHPREKLDMMPLHQIDLMYNFPFLTLEQACNIKPEQAEPLAAILINPKFAIPRHIKRLLLMDATALHTFSKDTIFPDEHAALEKLLALMKKKCPLQTGVQLAWVWHDIKEKGHDIAAVLAANLESYAQFDALAQGISLQHVQAWSGLDDNHLGQYRTRPWMQELLPKLIEKNININEILDANFDVFKTKFLVLVKEASIDWIKTHPNVEYHILIEMIEKKNITVNLEEVARLEEWQWAFVHKLTIPQALLVRNNKNQVKALNLLLPQFQEKQVDIDAILNTRLVSYEQYLALAAGAPLPLVAKLPRLSDHRNVLGLNISPEDLEKCDNYNACFLIKPYCFKIAQVLKVKTDLQNEQIQWGFQAFQKHNIDIDAILDADFQHGVYFMMLANGVPLPCVKKLQDLDIRYANELMHNHRLQWIYTFLPTMVEYNINIKEVLDAELNRKQVEFLVLTKGRATIAWIKAHPNLDMDKSILALKAGADFKEISEFEIYHFEIWLKAKAADKNLKSEDILKVTKPRQASLIVNMMEKYDFAQLVNLSFVALLALEVGHPISDIESLENWQISLLLGDETKELAPMTLAQVKQLRSSSASAQSAETTTSSNVVMFSKEASSINATSMASTSSTSAAHEAQSQSP